MLSRFAFSPSTYQTSSKTGNPGMSTVPIPLITDLLPSPKVTIITKSKDVDSILVDELIGSLQSYELDLPKTSKSKSMALKSVVIM